MYFVVCIGMYSASAKLQGGIVVKLWNKACLGSLEEEF
jgi:hypothetical protein